MKMRQVTLVIGSLSLVMFLGIILTLWLQSTAWNHSLGDTKFSECMEPSRETIFRMKPNCEEIDSRSGKPKKIRYNRLGLRDRDYPALPPTGVKRILFVGGSLMLGPGLDEAETFPRQMERLLRKKGFRVEIINGSIAGFTGAQVIVQLRKLLEAYSPDYVIYIPAFLMHLVRENAYEAFIERNPEGIPAAVDIRPSYSAYGWIPGINHWARQTKNRGKLFQIDQSLRILGISWRCTFIRDSEKKLLCLAGRSLNTIDQIRTLASGKGAKFMIIAPPSRVSNAMVAPPFESFYSFQLIRAITPLVFVPWQTVDTYFQKNPPAINFLPESLFTGEVKNFKNDILHFDAETTNRLAEGTQEIFMEFLSK
jgi:hypothetical protein